MLLANCVSAQQLFGPRSDYYLDDDFYTPRMGIEAGVDLTNIISKATFKTNTLTGFNAGFTFLLPIEKPLSFVPEILFVQKGYTANTDQGNLTQRTEFVEFPLLAKINITPRFSFLLGPEFSIIAARQNTYDTGFAAYAIKYYEEAHTRATYFNGVVGLSFRITKYVDIHARYEIDLQQNAANGNIYVPGYSNTVWQFGIGTRF